MLLANSIKEFKAILATLEDETIGLIPTMGSLHSGHASLIKQSLRNNAITIVTIFVNAPQFNDKEDLAKYPSSIEKDKRLCEKLGVNILLLPREEEIYPDNYSFKVIGDTEYSRILEAKSRPNHFTGVLTVVLKLFLIIKPTRAYFGEKDYQQFKLVQDMTKAFLLEVEVVCCKTIRNKDGLPMSSRNTRLSPESLKKASSFSKVLITNLPIKEIKRKLEQYGFKIEYIEEYNNRRFGAVKFKNIRLIDNIELNK